MTNENVARVRIGDLNGHLLAEIEPELGIIQWRLNDIGKVPFRMSRSDPKLIREFFLPGNRMFIEFDNGLPPWGGIMDPPTTWTLNEYRGTSYSPEYILKWRQTDRGRYFDGRSVGDIFSSILTEAVDLVPELMEIGEVYPGKSRYSPEYHLAQLFNICQKSLGRIAGTDFNVGAAIRNGRILFTANLYGRRGKLRQNVALEEGQNCSEITLVEQGPIINDWDMAGAGNGWGDDRIFADAWDPQSIATYGLRQGSAVYSDIAVQASLDETAEVLLNETKDPKNRWSIKVHNLEPAKHASYDIGDTIRLMAPNFGWDGFDGWIRVIARNWNPKTAQCVIVVEESPVSPFDAPRPKS